MKKISLLHWLLVFLVMSACKEKYVAKTNYPYTGYLVVEGFVDAGGGTTEFKLSRTVKLDSAFYQLESGASLTVESENGQAYPLFESSTGRYSIAGIPVAPGDRFRLHIITNGSREYLSDYTKTQITPPVDSVSWKEKDNGLQIYVSSHDAANATLYYKWRFDETWKFNAKYFADLVWDPTAQFRFRYRSQDELLYTCWKSDTSSQLLLGSTAKLASDVLSDQPVTFIPYPEQPSKLISRYSIQVYLEALAEDEYQWYDKLRKNTESVGSIFDAQPSDLSGNIHGITDPTETVIGWVGSHTVSPKRIFIGRGDLPSGPSLGDGYGSCGLDTLSFGKDDIQIMNTYDNGVSHLPTSFYTVQGQLNPVGVIGSSEDCADCRVRGGLLTRPDFWQD